MTVPTIALYASPSSVCAPHQINSHSPYDLDVNGRSTSSSAASPSQRALMGGLSCLFSTPPIKSATCGEELGSLWHDRAEELGSSYRYSSLSSSFKRDQAHQSPVSVLQRPSSSTGFTSRGPPLRTNGELNAIRSGSMCMFNGFVRHALGSCVDYDSQALEFDSSSSSDILPSYDLTFNMEDCFLELELPSYAKDLLSDAQSRHPIFRDDFVIKAFYETEKAHRGQLRRSGHPYLQHCVETAMLLAEIGANSTVVAAGILHDTVDDSSVTYNHISTSLGAAVADLVQGVSKLSQMSKLARDNNTASKTVEADRLHTMFLAMADARAVLIKLADRLHNMSTLDALPPMKQQTFAKETSEIFVPLANRLGVSTWKEQLENLCFKYLDHDQYRELSSKFLNFFDEAVITSSLEKLEQALKAEAVSHRCLSGRHKSLVSIHSKMLKKKLNMEEVHDIHGLRLIVETQEECYRALKVVHKLWHEVPGKFKDYIVYPKCNGYQSLHTVVLCDNMVPLEVQIRTKKMHLQAEYGFAAHWRYKEGECKHSSFILQMVEWARWVISWQCEATTEDKSLVGMFTSVKPLCTFPTHSKDCTFSCKPHTVCNGPVYVIMIQNDKMSVQQLPANSSVMDLLETTGHCRWTSYGFALKEELRPRVNHEPVSDPTCKLKMGDIVELTPAIPDKSLPVYREEIQRMYDKGRCYNINCTS